MTFATYLAILVPEPLGSVSTVGVIRIERFGQPAPRAANLGTALLRPLGSTVSFWGSGLPRPEEGVANRRVLPFGSGALVRVSLSGRLPRIHSRDHDRDRLCAAVPTKDFRGHTPAPSRAGPLPSLGS